MFNVDLITLSRTRQKRVFLKKAETIQKSTSRMRGLRVGLEKTSHKRISGLRMIQSTGHLKKELRKIETKKRCQKPGGEVKSRTM